jgi:hypothetical protein
MGLFGCKRVSSLIVHRGNGLSQPVLTTYKAAVPHGFGSHDQSLLEITRVFKWRRLRASSSTFR